MNYSCDNELLNSEDKLSAMLKYQKKQTLHSRITMIAVLLFVVFFVLTVFAVVPRVVSLSEKANDTLETAETELHKVDTALDDVSKLIGSVNNMVDDNTDAIGETVKKLNGIDFDSLNDAIKNLNDVIKPLSDFFKNFSSFGR